tara:strand:- start:2447 stop:3094 length:648 start_codon:yes stop_codon:yes gene_type:complete
MANTKISAMTAGSALGGTEVAPFVQSAANVKITATQIKTFAVGAGSVSVASGKTVTVSNTLTLAGTDSTTMTFPATSASVARTDAGQTFTGVQVMTSASLISPAITGSAGTVNGGFTITSNNLGTLTTGTTTLAVTNGPQQYMVNGGAHTLAAPIADGNFVLYILNNGSAGTITWSGFTVGASPGDALTTTNTSKFFVSIMRVNSISTYIVKALQ